MLDPRLTFFFQGTMDDVPYIDLFYWLRRRKEYKPIGVAVENIHWS
jgi:hypothetical protein